MLEYWVLDEMEVVCLESCIDCWNDELGLLKNFIFFGGFCLVVQVYVCCSLVCSVEWCCQVLDQEEMLEGVGLCYLNWFFDLLFVVVCVIVWCQGVVEIFWEVVVKLD